MELWWSSKGTAFHSSVSGWAYVTMSITDINNNNTFTDSTQHHFFLRIEGLWGSCNPVPIEGWANLFNDEIRNPRRNRVFRAKSRLYLESICTLWPSVFDEKPVVQGRFVDSRLLGLVWLAFTFTEAPEFYRDFLVRTWTGIHYGFFRHISSNYRGFVSD